MFTTRMLSYLLIAIVEDQKRLAKQQDNPGIRLLRNSLATIGPCLPAVLYIMLQTGLFYRQ